MRRWAIFSISLLLAIDARAQQKSPPEPPGDQTPSPSIAPFMTAREAPRVAFSALIERGMVSPGDHLVDAKKRYKATVRADGAVSLGDTVGSIHRIGAVAQGLDACNGWTFWHVETAKGLTSIDAFRTIVRAEMAEAL